MTNMLAMTSLTAQKKTMACNMDLTEYKNETTALRQDKKP
jgi:hypothetical protein